MDGSSPETDAATLNMPTSAVPSGVTEEDVTITALDADVRSLSSSLLCVTDDLRVVRCSSVCDEKIPKTLTDKPQVDSIFTDYLFDPRLSPIRPIEAKPLGGDHGQEEKCWLEVGEKTYEELVSGISAMCETNHEDDSVFEKDLDLPAKLHSSCTVVSSTPDLEMLKKDKFKTLFDVKDSEKYPGHRHLPFADVDFSGRGSRRASASCPPSFIASSSHSVIIGQPGRFKDVDVSRVTDTDATILEEISDTGPDVLGLDEFTTIVDSEDEDMLLMTIDEWQTVLHNSKECSKILEGKLAKESVSEDIEKGKKRKPSEAFVIDLQKNFNEVQEFMVSETVLDVGKQMSSSNLSKKQKTETTLCETTAGEDDIRAIVRKQIADMVREVSQINDAEKLKLTDEYLQREQTDAPPEVASSDAVKPSPKKCVFGKEGETTTSQDSHTSEDDSQYKVSLQVLEDDSNARVHASECADSLLIQQSGSVSLERQQTGQGIKVLLSNDRAPASSTLVLPATPTTEVSVIPVLFSPGATIPCLDVSLQSIPLPPSPNKDAVTGSHMDQVNSIESTSNTVLSAVHNESTSGSAPIPVIVSPAQKPELNEEQPILPDPFQSNALSPANKTKPPPKACGKIVELSEQNEECRGNSNLVNEVRPSDQSSRQVGTVDVSNEKSRKTLGVPNKPLSELSNLPRKSAEQNSGFLSEDKAAHILPKVQSSPLKQIANLDIENIVEKLSPLKRKASPSKVVSSILNVSSQRAKVFKSSDDAGHTLTTDKTQGPKIMSPAYKVDTGPHVCASKDSSPKVTSLISLSTSVLTSALSKQSSTDLRNLDQSVDPKGKISTSTATSVTKGSLISTSLTEPKTVNAGKMVASKVNASTLSAVLVKTNALSVNKLTAPLTSSLGKDLMQPLAPVNCNLAGKTSAIPVSSTSGKGVFKRKTTVNKTPVSAVKTSLITSNLAKSDGQVTKVADSAKLVDVGSSPDVAESSSDKQKNFELNKGELSFASDKKNGKSLSRQTVTRNPDAISGGATKADKLSPVASTAKVVCKTADKITSQRQISLDSAIPKKGSKPTIQRQVSLDNTVETTVDRPTSSHQLKSVAVVSKADELGPLTRSAPQYLTEDNALIQQVKKRWDCKAIPSPETNLTCANYWRRNQATGLRPRNALLEGDFRFSPLIERMKSKQPVPPTAVRSNKRKRPDNDLYLNPSDGYMWDGKRARYDQHVEFTGEVSASIKFQIEKLEQNFRERCREIFYQEERMRNELSLKHELQMEKVSTQQREEMEALYVRSYDHRTLHRSLMWLRQQHQLYINELHDLYYCNVQRLTEETKQQISHERKNYFEIAEQLEQLMNKEKTKSYQHTGQNVTYKMIHLVKAPCRSNNQKKSWVKVYLPADVGSSIIREDLIYDAFYVY
ncbi:uncharacterized protein LOC135479993 [Liolophura sinensis]|uniref:uncharacterized protein LOC135479993 n=1 Tax=Liolophura sinensis TaxID=3198878 RepID=UPI00315877E4